MLLMLKEYILVEKKKKNNIFVIIIYFALANFKAQIYFNNFFFYKTLKRSKQILYENCFLAHKNNTIEIYIIVKKNEHCGSVVVDEAMRYNVFK